MASNFNVFKRRKINFLLEINVIVPYHDAKNSRIILDGVFEQK